MKKNLYYLVLSPLFLFIAWDIHTQPMGVLNRFSCPNVTYNEDTQNNHVRLWQTQIDQKDISEILVVYKDTDTTIKLAHIPNLFLDISNNNLKELPSSVTCLKNLVGLNASHNKLELLPDDIGNLISLTHLELSTNKLKMLPQSIGNLINLKTLNIFNNKLTELPVEIGSLYNLREFDLGENKLTTVPNTIGNLSKLYRLNLRKNTITTLPAEIASLENISILDLADNTISTLPAELGFLQNLTTLDISYNKTLHFSSEDLLYLYRLKSLNLEACDLKKLPHDINILSQLEELLLEDNKLTSLPACVGKLFYLERITLQNNTIPSADIVDVLSSLPLLRSLDTNNTQINEINTLVQQKLMAEEFSFIRLNTLNEESPLWKQTVIELYKQPIDQWHPLMAPMVIKNGQSYIDLASLELEKLPDISTVSVFDYSSENPDESVKKFSSIKNICLNLAGNTELELLKELNNLPHITSLILEDATMLTTEELTDLKLPLRTVNLLGWNLDSEEIQLLAEWLHASPSLISLQMQQSYLTKIVILEDSHKKNLIESTIEQIIANKKKREQTLHMLAQ